MPQQVGDDILGEGERARLRMRTQRRGFFSIRQGMQLERKAPGEPAAQVLAQRELRRRGVAAGDQGAAGCAHAVVQIEQLDLPACRQKLHIVHGDDLVVRRAAARHAAEI